MSRSRTVSCALSYLVLAMIQAPAALAQVVRDGSIGPDASVQPQGPAFQIPDTMGETVGGNLFHSFSFFNVNAGESVTFQANSSIHNIFARVTGGGTSSINGRIVAPANLFLANPYGFVFGARAVLDVSGSFHVTTGDYLEFGDRSRFYTSVGPGSVLTVADPKLFGFLSDRPAAIGVTGSRLNAQRLSLVGGHVAIRDGVLGSHIDPPALGVDLVSVASSGTVSVPGAGALTLTGFTRLGDIEVSNGDLVASGPVTIRGGTVVGAGSALIGSAALVDVEVDRLELRNQATIQNAVTDDIQGDIRVTARRAIDFLGGTSALLQKPGIFAVTLGPSATRRSVQLFTPALTIVNGLIDASTAGDGAGPDVLLDVGDLRVLGGGYIKSGTSDLSTDSTGPGGDLVIRAKGLVEISGAAELFGDPLAGSNISTFTATSGAPGALRIEADRVRLANGGQIISGPPPDTAGAAGGNVDIWARESIEIVGSDLITGITSDIFNDADPGRVQLTAPRIVVTDAAEIRATTHSTGNAGEVHISAGTLSITNFGRIASQASAGSTGRGGSITVDAQTVDLNSGTITTNTRGAGQAGNITVNAADVRLSFFSDISSESAGASTGNAGSLAIRADRLYLDLVSELTTRSAAGAGGDMRLDVRQWIEAIDSEISTSVQGGAGGGGDITITMDGEPDVSVMILERTRLTAQASQGRGGNMLIRTDALVPSAPPGTVISASSEFGVDGDILIDAPDTSILTTLTALPSAFLDAATLLRAGCSAERRESVASLLLRGRGGMPPAPGGLLPGSAVGDTALRTNQSAYSAAIVGATGDGRPVLVAVRCGR